MVARRSPIALLMVAMVLYSGMTFVAPRQASDHREPHMLEAAMGIPAGLVFPATSLARTPDTLDNIFSNELSLGALGLPWLSWNLVYALLALFAVGSILAFPVLVGAFLSPAETVQEVRNKPGDVRREFRQPGQANPILDQSLADAEYGPPVTNATSDLSLDLGSFPANTDCPRSPLRLDLGSFPVHENRPRPRYDLFCVVDFECTCEQYNIKPHEIIEFPAVFLNAHTLDIEFEFHAFVRPTEYPRLSRFCTTLTGIEQETVDAAQTLGNVMSDFEMFISANKLTSTRQGADPADGIRTFCIATDGPWDVQRFLQPECDRKRIRGFESTFHKVVNIRRIFHDHFEHRGGVRNMLGRVGLSFEGREHSGIADSRNIARLLAVLLADGVDVMHNMECFQHR